MANDGAARAAAGRLADAVEPARTLARCGVAHAIGAAVPWRAGMDGDRARRGERRAHPRCGYGAVADPGAVAAQPAGLAPRCAVARARYQSPVAALVGGPGS